MGDDSVAQDGTRLRSVDLEGPNEAVVTLMFSPLLAGQDIEQFTAAAARNRAEATKAQYTHGTGDGRNRGP